MFKKEFPSLGDYTYLDSAATTHKPKVVIDRLQKFYSSEYATIHRGVYKPSIEATDSFEKTREAVQGLINAKSSKEIIFTKNTTDSINLVAYSFGELLEEGDEIIISEIEHHSNIIPWQMLCNRKKTKLIVIPVDDNSDIIFEEFEKKISSKTKLIAIAHMANATGTIHPIEKIVKLAKKYESKVLIDGAQSIVHLPIDVQKLDIDFFAFSSHKMYGPTGVGVLYGKEELLEQMMPIIGGGDMVEKVFFDKSFYQKSPQKFEAGTPAIAEVVAFKEAIDFIKKIKIETISSLEMSLMSYLEEKIVEIENILLIGNSKNKGPICSFIIKNIHPLDIGTFLDSKKISIRTGHLCSQNTLRRFDLESICRVSLGIYNDEKDIDLFIEALKKASRYFI